MTGPSLSQLTVALAVLVLGAPGALAQTARTAESRAAALAAWQRCFPTGAQVPELPEIAADDSGSGVTARRTSGGFHLDAFWAGSGVEALYGGVAIELRTTGCRALWVRSATYDGALATRVRIGWVNRGAPSDADLRALVAEPARKDDPDHAVSRAWLSHACAGGPDSTLAWTRAIEGPIAPAQPWQPGAPRGAPITFWSIAALDAINAHAPLRPSNDDELLPPGGGPELAGITVPPIDRPARTRSIAGIDLFESALLGRNAGRAIAIHDRRADRHRWVVVTRGCVQGTTVDWIGAVGHRIVGVTWSAHGRYAEADAILVIDVATGTAWAVRLPEEIREARTAGDSKIRASLSGARLTLKLGPAASTIDLAPKLAVIPAPP